MITKATDQQWKLIEECRLRWLNDEQTAQYPIDEIQSEVLKTFDRMEMQRPNFVWVVDSPDIARIIDSIVDFGSNLWSNLGSNLWSNLDSNLDSNLRSNLDSNLRSNLDSNLDSNLWWNLWSNLGSNLDSNLRSNLWSNLGSNLDSNLRSNLGSNLKNTKFNSYCGIWLNAYAGWFEGADILGVPRIDGYEDFIKWNRLCPVWMWSEKNLFILKRPTSMYWSETINGLHNDSGPAVYYSDFFKLWNIGGIQVDEQIVMRPETQTIEQINNEKNSDIKSVRIERFGWERYLKESEAKLIDSSENYITGCPEALYSVGESNRLVVVCPTGRNFTMGVPSEVKTCTEAQRWLGPTGNCLGAT